MNDIIQINEKNYRVSSFRGKVLENRLETRSTTHVSGGGGGSVVCLIAVSASQKLAAILPITNIQKCIFKRKMVNRRCSRYQTFT